MAMAVRSWINVSEMTYAARMKWIVSVYALISLSQALAQSNAQPDVFEMRRRCQSSAERLSEPMLKAMQVGKIQYRVEVKSNYDPETKKCYGLIDSANKSFSSSEVQYHYAYLYNAYSGEILATITQSKNNTVAEVNDERYDGPLNANLRAH